MKRRRLLAIAAVPIALLAFLAAAKLSGHFSIWCTALVDFGPYTVDAMELPYGPTRDPASMDRILREWGIPHKVKDGKVLISACGRTRIGIRMW